MTPGELSISVIIATFDRAELLAGTLESLDAQTTSPEAYEVIVIDDGSVDSTPAVCLPRVRAGRLRYRRLARVGNALAKNEGLLAARAPLLLFLDDDLAVSDLLEQHLQTHEAHPQEPVAVRGSAAWAPGLAVTPLMELPSALGRELSDRRSPDGGEPVFHGLQRGQWSCKRRFLLDHGIFDPGFTSALEEVELSHRLVPHGLQVIENPGAVTYLAAGVTLDDLCARSERRGRALALLSRLHTDTGLVPSVELREAAFLREHEVPLLKQRIARARQLESLVSVDPAAPESLRRELRDVCGRIERTLEASAISRTLDPGGDQAPTSSTRA